MIEMMTARFFDRASRAFAILVLSFGVSGGVNAQTPYSLGSYTDWNVWELDEGGQKICYIVSEPKKQAGNYTRRGKPAVLVTRRPTPKVTDEVSVQPARAQAPIPNTRAKKAPRSPGVNAFFTPSA